MNISAINNYWANLRTQTSYLNNANVQNKSNPSEIASNPANLVFSSVDGDTLELSGSQSNTASIGIYGPPPMNTGNGATSSDPIKSFLDKVANGTATQDDITSMQTVLQQIQQQFAVENTNDNNSGDSTRDSMKSFLDKVASGTATTNDLTSMQSILQKVNSLSGSESVNNNSDNADSDPIKSFLNKVADGTATQADLTNMQSVLTQMKQQSDSEGTYRHHHHHGSESNRTNPTSTSLDTTNLNGSGSDPIKSFLDKVTSGTATNDDLYSMQSILQQMQQQFLNGFTNSNSNTSNT